MSADKKNKTQNPKTLKWLLVGAVVLVLLGVGINAFRVNYAEVEEAKKARAEEAAAKRQAAAAQQAQRALQGGGQFQPPPAMAYQQQTPQAYAAQAMPARPPILKYGSFTVSTGRTIEEIDVPAGYSIEVGIVDNVPFQYCVDGQVVHTFPKRTARYNPDGEQKFKVGHAHKAGFRIVAGDPVTRSRLGYIVFMGARPTNWWELALSSPED